MARGGSWPSGSLGLKHFGGFEWLGVFFRMKPAKGCFFLVSPPPRRLVGWYVGVLLGFVSGVSVANTRQK